MPNKFEPENIEKIHFRAIPALEEIDLQGWVLRFSKGFRDRWNCAVPITGIGGLEDVEKTVAQVEVEFENRSLTPCFKIFTNTPAKLTSILENRGYDVSSRQYVYVRELDSFLPYHLLANSVHHNEALTDEWINAYIDFAKIDNRFKDAAYDIYASIRSKVITSYYIANDRIVGTCLGTLIDDFVIINCTIVSDKYKDRGADKALLSKVLEQAQRKGVKYACVSALSTNMDAIELYKKADFSEAYSYIFRKKQSK